MKTFDNQDMSMEEILSSIKKHIIKNKKGSSDEKLFTLNGDSFNSSESEKNLSNKKNQTLDSENFENNQHSRKPIKLILAKSEETFKKNLENEKINPLKINENFLNEASENELNFKKKEPLKEIQMPSFLQSIKNEVIAEKISTIKKDHLENLENFQNKNDEILISEQKDFFFQNKKTFNLEENFLDDSKKTFLENENLKIEKKIISKTTESLSTEPIESLILYTKKLAEIKEKKAEEERGIQTKTLDKIFDEAIRAGVSKWIDENLHHIVKEIVEREIKKMISSIVD